MREATDWCTCGGTANYNAVLDIYECNCGQVWTYSGEEKQDDDDDDDDLRKWWETVQAARKK